MEGFKLFIYITILNHALFMPNGEPSYSHNTSNSLKVFQDEAARYMNSGRLENIKHYAIMSTFYPKSSNLCQFLENLNVNNLKSLDDIYLAVYTAINGNCSTQHFKFILKEVTQDIYNSDTNSIRKVAFIDTFAGADTSTFHFDWFEIFSRLDKLINRIALNNLSMEDHQILSESYATISTLATKLQLGTNEFSNDTAFIVHQLFSLAHNFVESDNLAKAISNYYFSLLQFSYSGFLNLKHAPKFYHIDKLLINYLSPNHIDQYTPFINTLSEISKRANEEDSLPECFATSFQDINSIEIYGMEAAKPTKEFKIYDSKINYFAEDPGIQLNKIKISIDLKMGLNSNLYEFPVAILIEQYSKELPFSQPQQNWAMYSANKFENNKIVFSINLNNEALIPVTALYSISILNLSQIHHLPPKCTLTYTWLTFKEHDQSLCPKLSPEHKTKACYYSQFFPSNLIEYEFSKGFEKVNPFFSSIALVFCTIAPFTVLMFVWLFIIKTKMDFFDFSLTHLSFCVLIIAQAFVLLLYFAFLPMVETLKILLPISSLLVFVGHRGLCDLTDKRLQKIVQSKKVE